MIIREDSSQKQHKEEMRKVGGVWKSCPACNDQMFIIDTMNGYIWSCSSNSQHDRPLKRINEIEYYRQQNKIRPWNQEDFNKQKSSGL